MAAGNYKCRKALALTDSCVLVLAKIQEAMALFARREEDMRKDARKRSLDVEAILLEELF